MASSITNSPLETSLPTAADTPLARLEERLAKLDLKLQLSDAALDVICEAGFDPVFGARPLKRAIQQSIENPLSKELLTGKFVPGATVKVDAKGGEIVFG